MVIGVFVMSSLMQLWNIFKKISLIFLSNNPNLESSEWTYLHSCLSATEMQLSNLIKILPTIYEFSPHLHKTCKKYFLLTLQFLLLYILYLHNGSLELYNPFIHD